MATKINPFPHQLTQQAARNVEEVNRRNESLEAEIIQLNPSLQINQNKNDLLDSLDGNRCILADNYVRYPGVHDFDMVPNPHLKHPTTGDFRTDVHNCVYLSNYL